MFTILMARISIAQELNVGVEFAGGMRASEATIFSLGPIIEFRPDKSMFSINSGILFDFYEDETLATIPLSLKFIIGKTLRICPTAGGFIRSNSNYGWTSGIIIDYCIKERLFVFLKGEYNRDYWRDEAPTHLGETIKYTNDESSYWFGIGIKKNIL